MTDEIKVTNDRFIRETVSGVEVRDGADGTGELVGVDGTLPTESNELSNKAYVDAISSGLIPTFTAMAASMAPLHLISDFENGDNIDGVNLKTGAIVMVAGQTDPTENGLFVVNPIKTPTRVPANELPVGTVIYVAEGNTQSGNFFKIAGSFTGAGNTPVYGTDHISFTLQVLNPGQPLGSTTLAGLTDVLLTSPTSGQGLQFNGTKWINAAASGGSAVKYAQDVYVEKAGSDITGDGSVQKPYLTVNHALQSITDAVTTKRYAIWVGSGTFTETQVQLKPFIYLHGNEYGSSRINVTGAGTAITLDPTHGAAGWDGNSRTGLFNLYLTGATGLNFDLTGFSQSSGVFDLNHIWVNGPVTILGRQLGADFLQVWDALIFGTVTVTTAQGFLQTSILEGDLNVSDSIANPGGGTLDMQGNVIAGNISVSGTGPGNVTVNATNNRIDGNVTVNGAHGYFNYDVSSTPMGSISITSGAAVTRRTNTPQVHTVAANPTGTDDLSKVYKPGDMWINTSNNALFVCVNASLGAAVWHAL